MERKITVTLMFLMVFMISVAQQASSAVVLERSVERVLGNVYGLEVVTLPAWMTYSHYEVSELKAVLGGDRYVASLDLQKLKIERAFAVIGRVTSLKLDSSSAEYAIVGSDSGEVLVLDLKDWSPVVRFYTATRTSAISTYIVRLSNAEEYPRLIALDERGFLYVMRVARELMSGWFEAGPLKNQGAVTGLYGFKVLRVAPLTELSSWHSYKYLGDRVIALTDLKMPELITTSPFLGSVFVRVYYLNEQNELVEAYTGVFEPAVFGGVVEERTLYYIVSWSNYLLPLPYPRAPATIPVYYGDNGTLRLENLPPDTYKVRVLYEVVVRDSTTRAVLTREYYFGELQIEVKPGSVSLVNMTLSKDKCLDLVENCLLKGERFYSPNAMQGLLVLDTTRLPVFFEYGRDGRLLLLPIPTQLAETGARDLANSTVMLFVKPLKKPLGWDALNVEYIAIIGLGEWLAIYYLERDFRLADVGYEQPQLIYLGSISRSLIVSSDGRTMLVGTDKGLLFKICWLRSLGVVSSAEGLDRYFINSVLTIGSAPVTSIRMVDDFRALVGLENGRLQLIDINNWTPLWRGPPGYEGLDTDLVGASIELAGPYVVAFSPGTNRVYVFREKIEALRPLVVNLVLVTYDDEGNWYVIDPAFDIELVLKDYETGSTVAMTRARRTAPFYVPAGVYNLTLYAPGATAPASLAVSVGGDVTIRNLLLIYYPGFPLKLEIIDEERTIETIMRYHPPSTTVTLTFLNVDGEVVREPLKVTLVGYDTFVVEDGVLRATGVRPGEYTVHISPLSPLYRETTTTIRVFLTRTTPDKVVLAPSYLPIKILLWDLDAGAPVDVAHRVSIERLKAGSALLVFPRSLVVVREATVELPTGTYRLKLEPLGLDVYERPKEIVVEVIEPKTITINMTRKRFTLEITAKDIWGRQMEEAKVAISGTDIPVTAVVMTGRDGKVRLELPYGFYEVTISKRFYKDFRDVVILESSTSKEFIVEPGIIATLIRYAPLIVGAIGLVIAGIVFVRVRKIIAERLGEEEF
ncbi:MAG: hypothetical protein QXS13_03185 [Acidilobaceae archaeon]